MMEDAVETALRNWDGEELVVRFDRPTGAWILVAIHSTRLGPAVGGTRLMTYPSFGDALADALRLAESMTTKFAVVGFPRGGGKAVIAVPAGFDPTRRLALLETYGRLLGALGGLFTTGPDIGTSSEDMDLIDRVAAGRAFSRTPAAGGKGSSAPPTALGVFSAIEAACEVVFGGTSLEGRTVLVQGAGSVGGLLIERLARAGATVLFTDVDAERIAAWRARGFRFVPPEGAISSDCDVLAPCAVGGVLHHGTIPLLHCRIVAGSANNQLVEEADARRLKENGIAWVPDFVASVGGAMAITGMEALGWSEDEAEERVRGIGHVVRRVLRSAAESELTTAEVARRIARERLGGP
ncbi:MAG TPA: Glu/Leu/Phe/Val dehydrogenase dimerization domain-containing protein [Thermoanaerobaculia bacterium]|nr:Glu/Leu/Phe/Val dehydrogenase dimerization domain-containing protein [Thermoanaerobaculia bacterium]